MIVDNMEWVVVEMIAERNVQIYSCCVEPYPDVTYYIIMKVNSFLITVTW